MTKIRKQPRRTGKKQRIQTLKNPFLTQPLHCLPTAISQKLSKMQNLIFRHIDDVLCQPEQSPQLNIQLMKQALYQQQLKITALKCNGICSTNRKISATQAELQIDSRQESHCNPEELDAPVEQHRLQWLQQSLDFF